MAVKTVLVFCLTWLVTATALAAELRSLEVDRKKGHIFIASETYFDAPADAVYEILADYEGFHRISKVFTETRYLERDAIGNGKVYSRAEGCVLFFCKTIERVETLSLIPGREILATAIPELSDMDYSVTRWVFEPEGSGTKVLYDVEFKPSFWIPPVLGPMILRAKLHRRGSEAADRVEELANASQLRSATP